METVVDAYPLRDVPNVHPGDTCFSMVPCGEYVSPVKPRCKNYEAHPFLEGPDLVLTAIFSSKFNKEMGVHKCPQNCKKADGSWFNQPFPSDADIAIWIKYYGQEPKYGRFMNHPATYGIVVPEIKGPIAATTYTAPCCLVCHLPLVPKIIVSGKEATMGKEYLVWDCKGRCKTDDGQWVKHPSVFDRDIDHLGAEYDRFRRFAKPAAPKQVPATLVSNWEAHTETFVSPKKRKADSEVMTNSDGYRFGSRSNSAELIKALQEERDKKIAGMMLDYQKRIDALVNDELNAQ